MYEVNLILFCIGGVVIALFGLVSFFWSFFIRSDIGWNRKYTKRVDRNASSRTSFRYGGTATAILVLVVLALTVNYNAHPKIGNDEVGIPYVNGKPVAQWESGSSHSLNPFTERVEWETVALRRLTNMGDPSPTSTTGYNHPVVMETSDGKVLLLYRVEYNVLPSAFLELHQQYHGDWKNELVKASWLRILHEEARKRTTQELSTDKGLMDMRDAAADRLSAELKPKGVYPTQFLINFSRE